MSLAPYMQRALVEILLLAVLAGALGAEIVLRRLAFFTHSVGTAACDVPVLVWALTTPDPTGSVADFGGVLMASGSEVFAVLVGSVADSVGSVGFDGASFLAGVPALAEVSEVSEAAMP